MTAFTLAASTNSLAVEADVRDVADVLEFRMDKAEDPLGQLSAYAGELPIIATNRATGPGGAAAEDERLETLAHASQFDAVALVDVEIDAVRADEGIVDELRTHDVDLVVSHHDFEATPDRPTLDAIFDECARYGDVAKVATLPRSTADTLTLLDAVRAATERGLTVAGMAMGRLGSHTRVVGHLYGSTLGYAPLETDDTEYAPGQIPVHTLAALIDSIDEWSTPSDGSPGAVDAGSLSE